jgi:hypothetical protein
MMRGAVVCDGLEWRPDIRSGVRTESNANRAALLKADLGPAEPGSLVVGWSQFSDSNRGPTVYKTVALPLS